mmetsp:Transcript_22814/g.36417  ORF Transcript_22814/g.36417 Transcript_22814/m.36417 type:complete len:1979 (-) Transcript_22814:1773-7709(-)
MTNRSKSIGAESCEDHGVSMTNRSKSIGAESCEDHGVSMTNRSKSIGAELEKADAQESTPRKESEEEKILRSTSTSPCISVHNPCAWPSVLVPLLFSFHIGILSLAQGGAAFAAGDLSRSRGTSRESVPGSVFSMMDDLRKWVDVQLPESLKFNMETFLMLLEAEAVAHQLATCVLDAKDTGWVVPEPRGRKDSLTDSLLNKPARRRSGDMSRADVTCKKNGTIWMFSYPPPSSNATEFLSGEARLAEAVLAQFCNTYIRASKTENETSGQSLLFPRMNPTMVKANSLCNIQLLLGGMSPLTTTETNKLQDALDQLQLELEDWMTSDAKIETDVIDIVTKHNGEDGISMCIGVVHKAMEEDDTTCLLECEKLCNVDPTYRMNCLLNLYPKIPDNVELKAKSAYVLAQYMWDEKNDSETAEELLFEALFVLGNLKSENPKCENASVLSEVATNVMVLYGDILVENGKYKYAIGSYESAVRSYKIREQTDFKWLFRRLCSVCVEHLDWDRALKYHLKILHSTKREMNLNEFVYVSERVAMIFLDQRADFAQAESYLKLALNHLDKQSEQSPSPKGTEGSMPSYLAPSSTNGQSSGATTSSSATSSGAHHQSLRVKLQQRLAHVLLAANRAEDAARLLSQVLGVPPPIQSTTPPTLELKQTWMNKTWYGEQATPDLPKIVDKLQLSASRLSLLLLLAKCCLKLRWLADCTIALDQVAQEVTQGKWCDPLAGNPRPRVRSARIHELLLLLSKTSSMESILSYVVIRSNCCMYQGYPGEALEWINQVLYLAGKYPDSKSASEPELAVGFSEELENGKRKVFVLTLGQIGRLYYCRGKILQLTHTPVIVRKLGTSECVAVGKYTKKLCKHCGQSLPTPNDTQHVSISVAFESDPTHGYMEYVGHNVDAEIGRTQCIRSLWCAFEYFQLVDDALWQAKTLSRIAQVELRDCKDGKCDGALDRIEETARMATDLCADLGYAPLMIRCLLNMAELNTLRGKGQLAAKFWQEARLLLNTLYLSATLPGTSGAVDSTIPSSSFSMTAPDTSNAKMEMEQALSMFMAAMSSDAKKSTAESPTVKQPSNATAKEASITEEFSFPSTRIPGIYSPPGLTMRIAQHLSRLLRIVVREPTYFDSVYRHAGMFASWNWIMDECWKQHGFSSQVMLNEHIRSPIYDEMLVEHVYSFLEGRQNSVPLPEDFDSVSGARENEELRVSQGSPNLGSSSRKASTSQHRRNVSDSAVRSSTDAGGGYRQWQTRQRERMRQLRQQIQHDGVGCKRCSISRQAELMTTEGRTDTSLWSCFYWLKLLTHGEIGHSLRMEEVHTKNLSQLRKIRELVRASQTTNTNNLGAGISQGGKLFKSPPRKFSSDACLEGVNKKMHYRFFCGWSGKLVSLQTSELDDVETFSDLDPKLIPINLVLNGNTWTMENLPDECLFEKQLAHIDAQQTLFGLWDIVRSIGVDQLSFLLASLLGEQPIVIVASTTLVRARAIEALFGLIRPFRWLHPTVRNVPAVCAYALGKILFDKRYIVGLHASGVADFVNGSYNAWSSSDQVADFQNPTVLNLDDGWVEFSTGVVPPLPAVFRAVLATEVSKSTKRMSGTLTLNKGSSQSWGLAAKRRCEAIYDGMQTVFLWVLRFYQYFYDVKGGLFYGDRYKNAMRTEDPDGSFCEAFAKTKMFSYFLHMKDSEKSPQRLLLDDVVRAHIKKKARIYRSLVGLTRGCWVWMAVVDHTLGECEGSAGGSGTHTRHMSSSNFGSSLSNVSGDTLSLSTHSTQSGAAQFTSLFASFGLSSNHKKPGVSTPIADFTVNRVAVDIQKMLLSNVMSENGPRHSDGDGASQIDLSSSFFQTRPKKKWIYLEDKRLRYHYRKSKTREKGAIYLDPALTRVVIPMKQYVHVDSPVHYDQMQDALDKRLKVKETDVIDPPKPGKDDDNWVYLVTQLKELNKARTLKIRFMDKTEQQLWIDALRVKLMDPEHLIRVLETAYVS